MIVNLKGYLVVAYPVILIQVLCSALDKRKLLAQTVEMFLHCLPFDNSRAALANNLWVNKARGVADGTGQGGEGMANWLALSMGNSFVVLYALHSLSSQVDFAIGLQISRR